MGKGTDRVDAFARSNDTNPLTVYIPYPSHRPVVQVLILRLLDLYYLICYIKNTSYNRTR